jgi:flagellar biosynthesis anti-sigma factor FlgM
MKVDRSLQKVMSAIQKDGVEKHQVTGQKKETCKVAQEDAVSISSLIHHLTNTLSSEEISDVRSQKVTRLKADVEAGSYYVSGQAVAQKMLGICAQTT